MKKYLLLVYLLFVVAVSFMPFGGTGASLNNVMVLSLRLDYLLHMLVFIPLVPLWRMTFPNHNWGVIIPLAILLSAAAEVSHFFIPYRAYNINDLISNVAGVILGIIPAIIIDRNIIKIKWPFFLIGK